MRAQEFITEVFDKPYPIWWDDRWAPRSFEAHTETQAGNMRIAFIAVPNNQYVASIEYVVAIEFKVGGSFELTGQGDQWRIFATVREAVRQYLQRYGRPSYFIFSSKTDKRTRTYMNMVKRLAPEFGYQLTQAPPDLAAYGLGDTVLALMDRSDLDEVRIDNREGAGATGYNANVDYRGLRVLMRPSTFLRLAAPLSGGHDAELERYIAQGGAIGAPFLLVQIPDSWEQGDFDSPATVYGHEGRNRMSAVRKLEGDAPIEVHLIPAGENREYRNRHLTAQHIAALNRWMRREKSSSIESGPLFTVANSKELDEGWREKTAAAMAAATLGYGALTNTNAPEPARPTAAITQPTAPQADTDYARFQKTTPADLLDAAWAAGLRQDQLEHFIGQCVTETKNYQRLEEDLNYTSIARLMQVFPKRIKNKKMAKKFIGNPEALANYVYANRNGNKYAGDGWKYRGRGYLMLTGRELYQQAGDALGLDLVNNPDLVLEPKIAASTAIWYWQSKVSKRISDFSKTNVRAVTKHINPAMQGIKQRQAQYAKIAQR